MSPLIHHCHQPTLQVYYLLPLLTAIRFLFTSTIGPAAQYWGGFWIIFGFWATHVFSSFDVILLSRKNSYRGLIWSFQLNTRLNTFNLFVGHFKECSLYIRCASRLRHLWLPRHSYFGYTCAVEHQIYGPIVFVHDLIFIWCFVTNVYCFVVYAMQRLFSLSNLSLAVVLKTFSLAIHSLLGLHRPLDLTVYPDLGTLLSRSSFANVLVTSASVTVPDHLISVSFSKSYWKFALLTLCLKCLTTEGHVSFFKGSVYCLNW